MLSVLTRRLVPLVVCVLAISPAMAKDWPFGPSSGRFGMAAGDYYNLGIIGAKAKDADAEAAKLEDMGGGMRRGSAARPANDDGPLRLEVKALFPGGPAETAGLKQGDIIVGVGRKMFKEGCHAPLADALVKAEAGAKKGVLTLLIERDGSREKLEIAVPQGGKPAAKPLKDPARLAVFRKALVFLAEKQQASGGYGQTTSGANGAVVQAALAGLAWLAGGSDLTQGTYKDNVTKAADFVGGWCLAPSAAPGMPSRGGMDRGAGQNNWNQTNWGFAHAAIFLGELHARTPTRQVKLWLHACATQLLKAQEKSGGWAHGPGGPNALGYLELNIVTGLALCGLGMAQKAGYEIPADALARADAFLKASSSGDGGVGYSERAGQRGQGNIGRTAACWLGYVLLGKGKDGWAVKMKKFVERTCNDPLGGHASLQQHIFLGGVAAHAAGKSAKSRFWKTLERDMILARAPDGSFQPRPWHESLGMHSNSDVTFGEVWTTSTWAIILGCEPAATDHPGLPAWLGRD